MEFERSEDNESGSNIFSSDEVYNCDSSYSYDPEGISSDDNVDGCCNWSTTKQSNPDDNFSRINQNISEYGRFRVLLDEDIKPNDIIEHFIK